MEQLMAAMAVLVVAGALAWAVRRLRVGLSPFIRVNWGNVCTRGGAGGRSEALDLPRVTAQIPLTAHHTLHRVEMPEGVVILLATHPAGVTAVPLPETEREPQARTPGHGHGRWTPARRTGVGEANPAVGQCSWRRTRRRPRQDADLITTRSATLSTSAAFGREAWRAREGTP